MQNPFLIPAWPPRDEEIEKAVGRLLADGSWGSYSGAATTELCERLQAYFESPFVRLCSSGTIAIEVALRAVGVEAGDEVILAAYDFPGNFRAIELIGAVPVLVDLSENAHTLEPMAVETAISARTRALIVSHLHGQTAPLDRLVSICRRHGIAMVEDACQIPGVRFDGKRLGSFGDVGAISFGGSKLLTAGRGGAILTQDELLFQRARIYCDRGNDAFPLSELQAAVLVPQIDKLDERNAARQKMVRILLEELERTSDLVIPLDPLIESAFYKIPLLFPGSPQHKTKFIQILSEQGIDVGEGFRGFALRSARRCRKIGSLAHSQSQVARTCLLHHPVLLADEPTVREAARRIAAAANRSKNAE